MPSVTWRSGKSASVRAVRPRVGLVWSGNPQHTNDHNRSIPFPLLARLFDLDCDFISLQKEYREADRAALDAGGAVQRMDAQLHDFRDTAALCEHMDLVISVDTSVAHLAGALGKPLWVMLPQVADWRWLTERARQPVVPERAPVPPAAQGRLGGRDRGRARGAGRPASTPEHVTCIYNRNKF